MLPEAWFRVEIGIDSPHPSNCPDEIWVWVHAVMPTTASAIEADAPLAPAEGFLSAEVATLRAALESDKRLELNLDDLNGLDQAGLQLILASLKTGRFDFKPSHILTKALLSAGLPNYATETGGNNE